MIRRPLPLLSVLVALAGVAATAFAAESPATLPPLTLDESVARALAKNFDLTIQRLSNQSNRESVVIADAAFDPTFTASAAKGRSESSSLGASVPGSLRDSESARIGVSEKISSGATIGVSSTLARSKSGGGGTILNPAYNGDLSFTVTQPLLKGAGTAINAAAQQRARLGVQRSGTDLKAAVLTVVRNVESAYFNLVFARQQLEVRQFALDLAQKLLSESQDRRTAGTATDLDVLSAQVGVANARLNLVSAGQTVHDREDALLQLIGRFEFDQPIGPVSLTNATASDVSFAKSYALARASQPAYLSAKLALDQLRLDLVTAKDNVQPSLALGGAFGLSSTESTYGRAATQPLSGKGYDWQIDLTLSVPLGHRADEARYRQTLNSLSSGEASLQQIDQNLLAQVRTAVRAVETSRESVTISALAHELSKRQFELQKARYDAGLSTFLQVQQTQSDLNSAEISELQAHVSLRQALSDLSRLETTSLERYKIKLEE
jgi:outer membrane protein